MQVTVRVVHRVALAERVEPVALARVHLPRHQQRVEHLAELADATGRFGQARELGVEERDVERCVVDHQLGTAHELDPFGGDVREAWLSPEELGREPVHLQRAGIDVAIGAQVTMEHPSRPPAPHHFDAADFDDAMPEFGLEAGGLGIEDDLAHQATTDSFNADTTFTWSASLRYGCMGRLMTRRAAASETGKLPSRCPRCTNTGCRCRGSG